VGNIKRKSIHAALAAARAEDAAPPRYVPVPAWSTEANVAYLWADLPLERMAKIARADYLTALKAHLPEVLEAEQGAASWTIFQDRVHGRGEFDEKARAAALEAQRTAAQRQQHPVELDDEEYGLDRRHPRDSAAERRMNDHAEQERQRLLAAALKAGPRLFVP
jgi:hypothetical protein